MKNALRILLGMLLFAPLIASADASSTPYVFQRGGIFDCSQNGAYAMSVGAMSAIGGAYVPVADAAVELNSGTIVYKECVLREVVDREREYALTLAFANVNKATQTGRGGQPLYPVNIVSDHLDAGDKVVGGFVQGAIVTALNPAIQSDVKRSLISNYYAETRVPPDKTNACPYGGDLSQWQSGQVPFTAQNFWQASDPSCIGILAAGDTRNLMDTAIMNALQAQQDQLNQGRGFYPITDANGNVITPSSAVEQSLEQVLQSPIQQLQNANDIGQMIGALYTGLTTEVLSGSGLAGLTQSSGGQQSYLDKLVAESSAGVRNAAANATLRQLAGYLAIEQQYNQEVNLTRGALAQAVSQLRQGEAQCWNLIAVGSADGSTLNSGTSHVCSTLPSSSNTCQNSAGNSLTIATSTVFSQALIDSQITSLASTTASEVTNSNTLLALINSLIQQVSSGSPSQQQAAIQQVDQLTTSGKLHSQSDVQAVANQYSSVSDSMTNLVKDAVDGSGSTGQPNWADGTPNPPFSGTNATGWCNTNSSSTLDYWTNQWKH